MVRQRVRIRFSKQGDMTLIGHRDMMRAFQRAFRRAQLPLSLSEGFHPHLRMTFPMALAVGTEGTDEVMELELVDCKLTGEEIASSVARYTPRGLNILSAELLPEGTKKARVAATCYHVSIDAEHLPAAREGIGQLMQASSRLIVRPGKVKEIDVRKAIDTLTLDGDQLRVRVIKMDTGPEIGPNDIMQALDLKDDAIGTGQWVRDRVELTSEKP